MPTLVSEFGTVTTYADGFGRFHAIASPNHRAAAYDAQSAILAELTLREQRTGETYDSAHSRVFAATAIRELSPEEDGSRHFTECDPCAHENCHRAPESDAVIWCPFHAEPKHR